jgi:hypothetical protein
MVHKPLMKSFWCWIWESAWYKFRCQVWLPVISDGSWLSKQRCQQWESVHRWICWYFALGYGWFMAWVISNITWAREEIDKNVLTTCRVYKYNLYVYIYTHIYIHIYIYTHIYIATLKKTEQLDTWKLLGKHNLEYLYNYRYISIPS